MSERSENGIYGSFFMGESEFALSVTHVQEVVNSPPRYSPVPLGPAYLKGLFNLRGLIVPVVDLRTILKLPVAPTIEESKIAIIERDGFYIGLQFDRTGEIFKSDAEERSDFDRASGSVISGVFKKEQGRRIVQILDIAALFQLQNIPQQAMSEGKRAQFARKRGQRKQCISFGVGPARCAWGIEAIQEILKIDAVTESTLAINHCIGHIDLRGSTVPIIDLAALLGYREADRGPEATQGERRIFVMKIEREFFGLLVDAVESIVSYFPDELLPFPVLGNERTEMFLGCVSLPDQSEILLLNHHKLLSNAEILEITQGHSRMFQASQDPKAQKKQSSQRRTYITFVIENVYAVGIEEIREIVEYPSALLKPPGLPAHFRGILNLRGEMITVIDARMMYRKPQNESANPGKVLIFKNEKRNFGLVVDAVEAIVSFCENDKIKLPEMLFKHDSNQMTDDVLEAVEFETGGTKRSLMILNAHAIATRVAA